MKGHGSKFGRKKEAAIAALLAERNLAEAARVVGIDLSTLKRWLRRPEFIEEYRRARWEVVEQAHARVQQMTPVAASVLGKLMADPATPASGRIRAALGIFGLAREALDLDIETRVAELERAAGSARGSRKSSVVVEWASTKALPGPAATPAQISPAARLLAAPRKAERNEDTDQSQAHERVARMSDTELELRPNSPEAQKAKPKGPNGG